MKTWNLILLVFAVLSFFKISAQNIVVTDDDGYSADPSAMLDVKSSTKGFLVPRMTAVQRNAISSPATGLLVFDTNENCYYFYNGTVWSNISYGQIWQTNGATVYLSDPNDNVGVGTSSPAGKMEVKGDASIGINEPLFAVVNENSDTVFAVYNEGVRIWVNDDASKASGNRGGFAVGGYSPSKAGFTNEYLRVTPDSVRVYIQENAGTKASGNRGGFAVGGFSPSKSMTDYYFNIEYDSTEIINPSEARMLWYPNKEAFLSGRVLVENVDSVGTNSMATGFESKSIGDYSQAFGYKARAYGLNATALGYYANAVGDNSYAIGNQSYSGDTASYALGTGAIATGLRSFAIGSRGKDYFGFTVGSTVASGDYSYAFGMGSVSSAQGAFTFGIQDSAVGAYSTVLGYRSKASGDKSVAIGDGSIASGYGAFAIGNSTKAIGQYSTSGGANSTASGYASFALGNSNIASGQSAVALGSNSKATGSNSTAFGDIATASGPTSTAFGYSTTASGYISLTSGDGTKASGYASTAMGANIEAAGDNTFGIGLGNPWPAFWTITQSNTMAVMGGNVGIGTVSPDKLLHVAGDARIEGSIYYGLGFSTYNKPDFVFEDSYTKKHDILIVEDFINKYGHLPWVTAVKDEKDGINMTRMSFETLEAVENLQLQIIQLKKENIELRKRLEKLEN